MTSHAALTHAAAPAPPAFNGLFYATAATVIPVLFLAIAVQGRTYENLMKTFTDRYGRWMTPGQWIAALPAAATGITAAVAGFALLFSAWSEYLAIYALYQQQAESSTATQYVLPAVAVMILITAAGPAQTYWKTVVTPLARGSKWIIGLQGDTGAEPQTAKAQQASAETPQPGEKPQPGKAGPA